MIVGYVKQTFKYPIASQLEVLEPICDIVHLQLLTNNNYKEDMIANLEAGDILIVTRFIIVSQDIQELLYLLQQLHNKGVTLQVIQQEFDSSKSLYLQELLSVFPTFLEDIRYQRHILGIIKAKARGVKFGRKRKLTPTKLIKAISLKEQGYTSKDVANRFQVSKSTLLRNIGEYREAG